MLDFIISWGVWLIGGLGLYFIGMGAFVYLMNAVVCPLIDEKPFFDPKSDSIRRYVFWPGYLAAFLFAAIGLLFVGGPIFGIIKITEASASHGEKMRNRFPARGNKE